VDVWALTKRIVKGVLRRRKTLAVLIFLGASVTFVPISYLMGREAPRYRATAIVLLEVRPDRVPIFQEFSPFRPLPVQLAILKSRSLAEGVLDALPRTAYDDLTASQYHIDYLSLVRNGFARLRGYEPEVTNQRQRALTELQQARVRFESKGDGILEIAAEASRPQAAVDIVNTFIEVLLARTRTFNIDDARTSREFLEQQLADIKRNLAASEESLRTFTTAHGGVKVPERSKDTMAQLSQTEQTLAEIEANRLMLTARLQGLREKVETQKRAAPVATSGPAPAPRPASPDIQRLRSQLAQMETTLLDLRTKFTDQHPRIVLVKERIAEVQRQLGDAVKDTVASTTGTAAVPPAERVNFAEQLVALETANHTLLAQEEALRGQAEGLRKRLSGLSQSEIDYSRLGREVESNRNLYALLSDKLTAARIREQGEMKVVKIIDPPGQPLAAASGKRFLFLSAALGLAFVAGVGVPGAVEWYRRTVETEEDVEQTTGLPVLAVLPRIHSGRPRFLSTAETHRLKDVDGAFIFSEALRNLRVTIQLAFRPDPLRSLLVTSAFASEGKSTLVVNLGMAFGEAGSRVVLAETDFQRPTLHNALKVAASAPGLSEALETQGPVGGALVPVGDRMWMAPRGRSFQPEARGMLATNRLKVLVDEMTERADLVICDSSPVMLIPDNLFLASAVDGVILVARAGSTQCRDLARTKSLLEGVGARILGVVINEMPVSALRRHYSRYYRTYVRKEGK
jgi:capsular exopolysaccharide synthesis family protein